MNKFTSIEPEHLMDFGGMGIWIKSLKGVYKTV